MLTPMMFTDETYVGPPPTKQQEIAWRRYEINCTVPHGIKAIFFDLHGVLVDITGWHKVAVLSAMEDILGHVPKPLISNRHPFWKVQGGTMAQLDTYPLSPREQKAIYKRKQRYTRQFIDVRIKPITKIIDVMNYAQSIGMRLACVTNGNRPNAEKMLKAAGLHKYFEFIITREDVDGKQKPHPRPYLEARWRMGLDRKEALVIEDTGKGIMSAIDANCRTWWLKRQDDLSVMNLMKTLHSYRIVL